MCVILMFVTCVVVAPVFSDFSLTLSIAANMSLKIIILDKSSLLTDVPLHGSELLTVTETRKCPVTSFC